MSMYLHLGVINEANEAVDELQKDVARSADTEIGKRLVKEHEILSKVHYSD